MDGGGSAEGLGVDRLWGDGWGMMNFRVTVGGE